MLFVCTFSQKNKSSMQMSAAKILVTCFQTISRLGPVVVVVPGPREESHGAEIIVVDVVVVHFFSCYLVAAVLAGLRWLKRLAFSLLQRAGS